MTAVTAFQTAQNLAMTAMLRIPAFMVQATALSALGEAVLKGAGLLTYQMPMAQTVENYFTKNVDDEGKSVSSGGKPTWGKRTIEALKINTLFKMARPFKGNPATQNLKTFALLSVLSMGMVQVADLLAGKPHSFYNKVLECGFSFRIINTAPLTQIKAVIGNVRSAWGN